MGIKITEFGKTKDGKIVHLYTLTNKNGLTASFTDLGGTWVDMKVPDRNGNFEDICLGFDTVEGYESNKPHFGAIIGRYANRIKEGKFSLNGKEYQLETNKMARLWPQIPGKSIGVSRVLMVSMRSSS